MQNQQEEKWKYMQMLEAILESLITKLERISLESNSPMVQLRKALLGTGSKR